MRLGILIVSLLIMGGCNQIKEVEPTMSSIVVISEEMMLNTSTKGK